MQNLQKSPRWVSQKQKAGQKPKQETASREQDFFSLVTSYRVLKFSPACTEPSTHNIQIPTEHQQSTNNATSNKNKMNPASNDANNTYNSSTFQLLDIPTKFSNVDSLIRVSPRQEKPATMPDGYLPSHSDVRCGRGKQNWNMAGNINFRSVIRASVARYIAAPSKVDKTAVVVSVVNEIRRQDGHFLKQQQEQQYGSSGCWYDIGNAAARDKVGHSLRDQAGTSSASGAAKSPLQLAKKEHARRTAHAADDCDSVDSDAAVVARLVETTSLSSLPCKEEMIVDSVDSDAAVVARLEETSSLSSLSLSCTEEQMIDDCFPVTTLSRQSSLVPIEISSVVWGADLLPTNSSPLLLSDFVDCFDF
jgi:hypothetical protein